MSAPAQHASRPPDASRGAQARERMILAALDLFGKHGFDATTTRMIAQAARAIYDGFKTLFSWPYRPALTTAQ